MIHKLILALAVTAGGMTMMAADEADARRYGRRIGRPVARAAVNYGLNQAYGPRYYAPRPYYGGYRGGYDYRGYGYGYGRGGNVVIGRGGVSVGW